MTIPPVFLIILRTLPGTVHCTLYTLHCTYLSGTFLSWSLRALALLWEKMTGAEEAVMASIMVWPDTWEMST